jgi:hypothetical protein
VFLPVVAVRVLLVWIKVGCQIIIPKLMKVTEPLWLEQACWALGLFSPKYFCSVKGKILVFGDNSQCIVETLYDDNSVKRVHVLNGR